MFPCTSLLSSSSFGNVCSYIIHFSIYFTNDCCCFIRVCLYFINIRFHFINACLSLINFFNICFCWLNFGLFAVKELYAVGDDACQIYCFNAVLHEGLYHACVSYSIFDLSFAKYSISKHLSIVFSPKTWSYRTYLYLPDTIESKSRNKCRFMGSFIYYVRTKGGRDRAKMQKCI